MIPYQKGPDRISCEQMRLMGIYRLKPVALNFMSLQISGYTLYLLRLPNRDTKQL